MLLEWTDLLNEINDLFVKVTCDKIFKNEKEDFLIHVKNCLKLNNPQDWNYILASEDILDDSNAAISSFLKFGMSGPTKYEDLGEKYLRLYGVLNAIYMQQQAILNLYKFFQCKNLKLLKEKLKASETIEIRHKLASHSVSYNDQASDQIHAFVPVRIEMDDFKCSYFNPVNDAYESADLKKGIEEHLVLMCTTYIEIFKKTVSTIYKCNTDKTNTILTLLDPFEKMINGCKLMKDKTTGQFVVLEFV